jgi:hypothetical protein
VEQGPRHQRDTLRRDQPPIAATASSAHSQLGRRLS